MHSKRVVAIAANIALSAALCAMANVSSADVVVVVSPKSGVESLTPEQVSEIFLGKKAFTFPNGEEAKPVDLSEGVALRDEFYSKVTGKTAAQLHAYWSKLIFSNGAKQPKALPDSPLVKKAIAGTPGMIGYISRSDVDSSVKVVLAP